MEKKLLFTILNLLFLGSSYCYIHAQAGSLDCTFGDDGVVTTAFVADKENVSNDLAYYESGTHSGKLVVVGNADDASGSSDFAISRYLTDGSLDNTFSSDGKLVIDFGYDYERATGVAMQSDDKIVVVGLSGNPSYCAIARINADGTLDNTFSTDGKERVVEGYWSDVAIDGSGNIWVAGSTSNRSTVLKFSSTGSLLGTYEFDLTSGTTCCESFSALTVDASNNIVVVGGSEQTTRDMSVIRINSSGVLDTGFDADGIKYIDFGSDWDVAGSVAISSSGQIAVAGQANGGDFGIALLNSDGSYVTSFDTDGKVVVDLDGGSSDQSGSGVAFQSDGKIIGGCYAGGQYGVARFNTDGSLDTDFDTDGKVLYNTGVIGGDYPYSFVLSPAGKFVGVGIAWVDYGDAGKDFGILAVRTESEDMLFGSATCTQNDDYFSPGTQREILCIEVQMCGDLNPYSLTQFNLNTNGTTTPSDISNATVYYTGTSSSFSATDQFGTVTTLPNGSFTVNGSQELAHGTNYFWLAYTIPESATQGNFLDAECTQITIDGGIGNIVPDVTAPTEKREIKTIIFEEDFGENEEAIPGTWINQDVDGDGHKWTEINDSWGEVNGRYGGGVRSATWDNSALIPVDNRLVSPEIDLSGLTAATLTYYVALIDNSDYYTEDLETYISTSWNGTDNFPTTTQLESYTVSTYVWTKRTVSLDAYVGSTINLCFRHNSSTESWALRLDNILVTGTPAGSPEISISGNGSEISSGDADPSAADDTDFGDTITLGGSVTHTFTIANTGNAILNISGTPKVVIGGTNASDFSVVAVPSATVSTSNSTTFQIEFDPSGLGLRTANVSIANDDSDENPYTFSIQGTGVKDTPEITAWPTASSITYGDSVGNSILTGGTASVEGTFSFADSILKPTAGDILTTLDFTPDDTTNYKTISNIVSLLVNKAILSATAEDKSKTYGDENPVFTLAYSGWKNSDNVDSLDVEPSISSTADATTGAGTVAITVSGGSDNNYSFNTVSGTLTIDKAALSVTAEDKSKTYGEENPTFTIAYSGWIGTDNVDSLDVEPSATSTAEATTGAGTVAITITGGSDNNYSFNTSGGTLTIDRAELTVTAEDKSKTYGEENPAFTIAYSGWKGTDNLDSLDVEPSATSTAEATTGAGTVAITVSGGSDNNYSFNTVSGTLTIDRATLSATAEDKSKTYGDENPVFTIAYSGWKGTDNIDSLDVEPVISSTADASTGAGSVAITVSGGSDNNYNFNTTNGTLTIGKATLSVTAENKSREENQENPELTINCTGFIGSDNTDSINVMPKASTEANMDSSPGEYPITVSGGEDNNYDFTYTSGTLTVIKVVSLNSIVKNDIKIYPVPVTNKLVIEHNISKTPHILVIDGQGKIIINKQLDGNLLDLSFLYTGIYTVVIEGQIFNIVKK